MSSYFKIVVIDSHEQHPPIEFFQVLEQSTLDNLDVDKFECWNYNKSLLVSTFINKVEN